MIVKKLIKDALIYCNEVFLLILLIISVSKQRRNKVHIGAVTNIVIISVGRHNYQHMTYLYIIYYWSRYHCFIS